jgi:signal transduction histidine kinase
MTSSGKLLDFLINDILDFAQLRAGKFRMRVASFDLREAIEEIILIQ